MKIRNLWYVPARSITDNPDARATVEVEGVGTLEIADCLTESTREAIQRDIEARFKVASSLIKEAA